MAVTYGFYNALNHDRLYDAIQMSSIFDGIIRDGIFSTIGESLTVKAPEDGLYVNVGSGRAWFNHSWTLNDTDYPIEAEEAEVVLDRIDAVVLEVNNNETVRANSIKFIKGTPSSNPVRPTLTHNAEVNQYALAYVNIRAGQSTIFQADITNVIGTDETPFVTGLLQQVSIENLILQWEAEFRDHFSNWVATNEHEYETWSADMQSQYTAWMTTKMTQYQTWFDQMKAEGDEDLAEFDAWFQHMKDQLDEDAAGHLQAEIDALALSAEKGSVVTVSTINTSLYGRTVTISQGSESRTATFNNSGVAVFESIPYVGTVTVSSTDGTQTAESTLDIPYFGRYSVNIAFWAATVNISTTSSEFYNKEISVAKDGSTITTISFNNEGSASYIAMAPGLYTFNVNYEGMDFSSSVQVTEETTYNVVLNAWTATVSIATGLTDLYGRAITISKGGITVGTTNFDSTGRASYKAHETGTYVISATDSGGHTYSAQVDITEETLYEVSLGKPDGKTATPVNDISIWLACAGITDKAYTTLSQVLSDTATLEALVSDSNACDYMARSTNWASGVAADANAMALIGKFDYCANKLLSNTTWAETIAGSAYIDSVLNVKVPTMTSNTTPSGECSAGTFYSGYYPYYAFDGNVGTRWLSANGTTSENAWIRYGFNNSVKANVVKIAAPDNQSTYFIKNFIVQGSDDSTNWTDLYTGVTSSNTESHVETFVLSNTNNYSYYQIKVIDTWNGALPNNISVGWIQFYGRADQTEYQALVPTMTSNTTPSGECSGVFVYDNEPWKAFDGNGDASTSVRSLDYHGNDFSITYKFENPICVLKSYVYANVPSYQITSYKIQASNDGNDWIDLTGPITNNYSGISTVLNNTNSYLYYRVQVLNGYVNTASINEIQFYNKKEGVVFHSAANDTIYYMENGSPVILATTDANGKAYVDKSNLPEEGWKTLYSTVAKNPNNLSEDYSKVIHFSEDLSEVYVMPDGALYWYGWDNPDMPLACYAISNASSNLKAPVVYEDATNYRGVTGQNGRGIYACDKKISGYTKLKIYSKQVYKADANASNGMALMTTTNFAAPLTGLAYESLTSTNAGKYHENEILTLNDTIDDKYVMIHIVDTGNTSSHTNLLFYALWLE